MNGERLAGLGILLLCTALFYEGWRYPPDSRLYPLVLLSFLMLGAAIMVARPRPTSEEEKGSAAKALGAFAACGAYVFLVEPLGYFLATALFMLAMMAMVGLRRPLTFAVAVVGVNLGLYLLFVWQLKVPVPSGLLFQ